MMSSFKKLISTAWDFKIAILHGVACISWLFFGLTIVTVPTGHCDICFVLCFMLMLVAVVLFVISAVFCLSAIDKKLEERNVC